MKQLLRSLAKSYLTFLATSVVDRFKPRFIIITGTAGKTTTKRVIWSVLRQKFGDSVAESYGSMGTVVGLPLALLQMKPSWVDRNEVGPAVWQWPFWLIRASWRHALYMAHILRYPKIWVVEFTADRPGDFSQMLEYIKPTVAIVTNIGPGHLEFFGSEQGVAQEKGTIVAALSKDGFAVLNETDQLVKKMASLTNSKVYWVRTGGLEFAQSAARITGRIFDMNYSQIKQGLDNVPSLPHRFEISKGEKGTTIIDASYNANPVSIVSVLEEAKKLKKTLRSGRLIAVLGDMMELGADTIKFHKYVGQKVKQLVDLLITIGPHAKLMDGDYHAKGIDDIVSFLGRTIKKGDTIVVKASHGMRLDRLVDRLKEKL